METIVLERYQSRLEPSAIVIEKEGEYFNFWVYSNLHREKEVLSFDMIKSEDIVKKLYNWYREQEQKNVPISKALAYMEGQDAALQQAISTSNKKSK